MYEAGRNVVSTCRKARAPASPKGRAASTRAQFQQLKASSYHAQFGYGHLYSAEASVLHPGNLVLTTWSVIMESAISKMSQHHLLTTAERFEPIIASQGSQDHRRHDNTKAIASRHGLMGNNAHQGLLLLLDHPNPRRLSPAVMMIPRNQEA